MLARPSGSPSGHVAEGSDLLVTGQVVDQLSLDISLESFPTMEDPPPGYNTHHSITKDIVVVLSNNLFKSPGLWISCF